MEFFNGSLFLSFDLLIFGWCLKEYYDHKKAVLALKSAEHLELSADLKDIVGLRPDKKVSYAVIRGNVQPIGVPIQSAFGPSLTGVIQVIKLSEHRVARGFMGFWAEQRKPIHVSVNEMPFTISNGPYKVEIIDALSAKHLDLDVTYDSYEPSSLSFFDHIFGFFSGIRQRGIQTTEEMLRDGSFITAVGEVELEGNNLRLQPSSVGPMFLTTATKQLIVKKMEEAKSQSILKLTIYGGIAVVLITVLGRKFYLMKKEEWEERKRKELLEKARRDRLVTMRDFNLQDNLKCVVCLDNPKEIILLPCGHVCVCEDCGKRLSAHCPMCRKKIESRSLAFIT